jgi:hypothetical protein
MSGESELSGMCLTDSEPTFGSNRWLGIVQDQNELLSNRDRGSATYGYGTIEQTIPTSQETLLYFSGHGSFSESGVTGQIIPTSQETFSIHGEIEPARSIVVSESDYMALIQQKWPGEPINLQRLAGTNFEMQPYEPQRRISETWSKEDDLRFDFLVEKEALGKLSLEEAKELEQLSDKHDRAVVRVSDEDLSREKMCNKALAKLQDLLEEYVPLFAKRY